MAVMGFKGCACVTSSDSLQTGLCRIVGEDAPLECRFEPPVALEPAAKADVVLTMKELVAYERVAIRTVWRCSRCWGVIRAVELPYLYLDQYYFKLMLALQLVNGPVRFQTLTTHNLSSQLHHWFHQSQSSNQDGSKRPMVNRFRYCAEVELVIDEFNVELFAFPATCSHAAHCRALSCIAMHMD